MQLLVNFVFFIAEALNKQVMIIIARSNYNMVSFSPCIVYPLGKVERLKRPCGCLATALILQWEQGKDSWIE